MLKYFLKIFLINNLIVSSCMFSFANVKPSYQDKINHCLPPNSKLLNDSYSTNNIEQIKLRNGIINKSMWRNILKKEDWERLLLRLNALSECMVKFPNNEKKPLFEYIREEVKRELKLELLDEKDIEIIIYGSYLYSSNPGDVDLKVFIKGKDTTDCLISGFGVGYGANENIELVFPDYLNLAPLPFEIWAVGTKTSRYDQYMMRISTLQCGISIFGNNINLPETDAFERYLESDNALTNAQIQFSFNDSVKAYKHLIRMIQYLRYDKIPKAESIFNTLKALEVAYTNKKINFEEFTEKLKKTTVIMAELLNEFKKSLPKDKIEQIDKFYINQIWDLFHRVRQELFEHHLLDEHRLPTVLWLMRITSLLFYNLSPSEESLLLSSEFYKLHVLSSSSEVTEKHVLQRLNSLIEQLVSLDLKHESLTLDYFENTTPEINEVLNNSPVFYFLKGLGIDLLKIQEELQDNGFYEKEVTLDLTKHINIPEIHTDDGYLPLKILFYNKIPLGVLYQGEYNVFTPLLPNINPDNRYFLHYFKTYTKVLQTFLSYRSIPEIFNFKWASFQWMNTLDCLKAGLENLVVFPRMLNIFNPKIIDLCLSGIKAKNTEKLLVYGTETGNIAIQLLQENLSTQVYASGFQETWNLAKNNIMANTILNNKKVKDIQLIAPESLSFKDYDQIVFLAPEVRFSEFFMESVYPQNGSYGDINGKIIFEFLDKVEQELTSEAEVTLAVSSTKEVKEYINTKSFSHEYLAFAEGYMLVKIRKRPFMTLPNSHIESFAA